MADIKEIAEEIYMLTSHRVHEMNEKLLMLGCRHKHCKTNSQRKNDIAKRRKKNKNKKTHRK